MNKIRDLNHLKARTSEAAGQVTRYVLQRVRPDVEYRLDTCRVMNDAHVVTYEFLSELREVYLKEINLLNICLDL
jgi:hypothetical protein